MAQLKDSIVTGSLRVTDTTYTGNLIINNTTAPTIATNDYLLIADASDSNKVLKGPALNTSNTSVWLNLAGAWSAPTKTTVGLNNVTNDAQIPKSVFTEAYQILYSTGNAAYAVLTANKSTTKKFLRMTGASASAGAAPAWDTVTKTDVGLSNVTNDALIPKSVFTEAYLILYATGNASYAVLTANKSTTKKFLRMTGASASAGAAPAWDTVTKSDVGLGNVTNDAQVKASVGTAKGDMLYWSAANTPARLGIGSAGHILVATTNGPAWSANAYIIDESGSSVKNKRNELVLGNATGSGSNGSSFGRLALYSENTAGTYLIAASGTAWKTATLPAATGVLAMIESGTAKGSNTKPVKVAATGLITECSTYAGGTKVTLNGTAKGASDITIYAPTSYGTSGYVLNAAGENEAPTWINKGNGRIFYGTCDTAAATGLKKVICTAHDKVLTNGDVLIVRFTVTNTCATSSLQISIVYSNDDAEGTTAKNIKRIYNAAISNLNAKGELQKDSVGVFVYDGTYWIMTNADYNNTYDGGEVLYSAAGANRTAETAANGGIGLHRYSLEMMTANLTWSSIASKDSTAIANTVDNNKVAATASFLLNSPIYYQSTNTQCAPGGAINVNGYTCIAMDLRYSCGTSSNAWASLTVQKPVYLIGKMNTTSTFTLDATKWWGQALPNSNDGKIYIYLGMSYGANTIYLAPHHPIYWHDGTSLRVYTPGTAVNLNGTDKTGAAISIYAPTTSGTSGYVLLSGGANTAPTWIEATNSNVASTIVKRDANGDFNARTISLSGSLSVATGISMGQNAGIGITHNDTVYPVLVNYTNGNSGINAMGGGVYMGYSNTTLMDWLNGKMTLNSSGDLSVKRDLSVTRYCTVNNRIYAKEWIQFDNVTGLYATKNNAHFYPNNLTSYCPWVMNGAKGGYCGVVLGNATNYMAAMSTGEHAGLYVENRGRWVIYHQNSTDRIGIGGSGVSGGYTVLVNGSLYVTSTLKSAGVIYGTTLACSYSNGECSVQCNGNAGNIYFYSQYSDKNLGVWISSGNAAVVNWHPSTGYQVRYNILINNSSYLCKENIRSIPDEDCKKILEINPILFNYKKEYGPQRTTPGVIAEQLEKLIPEVVTVPEGCKDDEIVKGARGEYLIKSVDYTKFVPYLIRLALLLQNEINELKEKLNMK